jgi:hypothetical protein
MNTKDGMIGRLRNYVDQSIRKDRITVILYLNEVEDIIKFLSEEKSSEESLSMMGDENGDDDNDIKMG